MGETTLRPSVVPVYSKLIAKEGHHSKKGIEYIRGIFGWVLIIPKPIHFIILVGSTLLCRVHIGVHLGGPHCLS